MWDVKDALQHTKFGHVHYKIYPSWTIWVEKPFLHRLCQKFSKKRFVWYKISSNKGHLLEMLFRISAVHFNTIWVLFLLTQIACDKMGINGRPDSVPVPLLRLDSVAFCTAQKLFLSCAQRTNTLRGTNTSMFLPRAWAGTIYQIAPFVFKRWQT